MIYTKYNGYGCIFVRVYHENEAVLMQAKAVGLYALRFAAYRIRSARCVLITPDGACRLQLRIRDK